MLLLLWFICNCRSTTTDEQQQPKKLHSNNKNDSNKKIQQFMKIDLFVAVVTV